MRKSNPALLIMKNSFVNLPEDVILNIFFKLEDDPRYWARLDCVCTRFSALVRNICWRNKCSQTIPAVVFDLFGGPRIAPTPPGGWAALHKLAVCCPGLLHAGVLLENSDFGLERDIGPDENYLRIQYPAPPLPSSSQLASIPPITAPSSDCGWSLLDDLYSDTVYDVSESQAAVAVPTDELVLGVDKVGCEFSLSNKQGIKFRYVDSHLASGVWNLSREQGNKLLASRFRDDCLYICDWPGCVHTEEKRNYMLFRGIFKNFKLSRVWRTINDTNRSKIPLECAFCSCKETWDLHSAFCLKQFFGYHDDGEPVVRAYVCENGHVSGAWTERPMYT